MPRDEVAQSKVWRTLPQTPDALQLPPPQPVLPPGARLLPPPWGPYFRP